MNRVVALFAVVAFGLVLAACGPPLENQGKWAAAACGTHKGIITFDDYDQEGSGEGPANVVCGDGTHWFQHTLDDDECPEEREYCWENAAEVKERERR